MPNQLRERWYDGLARLRGAARPAVYGLRRLRARLAYHLRPAHPWDGRHHPVFERFPPWRGEADGVFRHDFLGIKTDPRFKTYLEADPPGALATEIPRPQAQYFELVFVLESVLAACDAHRLPFTMIELGAGYGPWLVTAYRAVQITDPRPVRLIGVEMEPRHYRFMREHLANNGIDPSAHELIHAAVSDVDGEAVYIREADPGLAYGQKLRGRSARSEADATPENDRRQPEHGSAVRIPCVSLHGLLDGVEVADLVHIDVQGEEWRVLRGALPRLTRKVRRLLVGTHSRSIHRRIRRLFDTPEWESVYDFRCGKRERTEFGDVHFRDGLLAVVNRTL